MIRTSLPLPGPATTWGREERIAALDPAGSYFLGLRTGRTVTTYGLLSGEACAKALRNSTEPQRLVITPA